MQETAQQNAPSATQSRAHFGARRGGRYNNLRKDRLEVFFETLRGTLSPNANPVAGAIWDRQIPFHPRCRTHDESCNGPASHTALDEFFYTTPAGFCSSCGVMILVTGGDRAGRTHVPRAFGGQQTTCGDQHPI